MMTVRERRERKQSAVVVLEGTKVLTQKGVAPLCKAIRQVVNPDDEIRVLTLLRGSNNNAGASDVCECNQSILHEQISQRKDDFLRIFRPFYNSCKSNEVKFQVKIAAGCKPKNIIVEEAKNVQATWIVMDRCFASYSSGTPCDVSLVSSDEEAMVQNCLPSKDEPERSSARDVAQNPKSSKLKNGSISSQVAHFPQVNGECQPSSSSLPAILIRKGSENQAFSEPGQSSLAMSHDTSHVQQDIFLGPPSKLTWEVILEITQGFKSRICNGQNSNYMSYHGYMEDHQSFVLVRRYKGNSGKIIEAEMKAAMFLHHKNILTLKAYYRSEEDIILVFPLEMVGTLDKHLYEFSKRQWELTFQDKLKIAIGIAQGIRYMHEDCPRGPIAHGKLHAGNIFLTSDLQPMIAGFEHATWLQHNQESPAFNNRYQQHEDCLDPGSMVLIKSDIFALGVVLLRLFCRRSVPRDDKTLIEWARPLLLDRAFHLLLGEESDDLDMHEIFRVMCTARMCTLSKPVSRPCITEVISTLKGENFCGIQSSPSDTST